MAKTPTPAAAEVDTLWAQYETAQQFSEAYRKHALSMMLEIGKTIANAKISNIAEAAEFENGQYVCRFTPAKLEQLGVSFEFDNKTLPAYEQFELASDKFRFTITDGQVAASVKTDESAAYKLMHKVKFEGEDIAFECNQTYYDIKFARTLLLNVSMSFKKSPEYQLMAGRMISEAQEELETLGKDVLAGKTSTSAEELREIRLQRMAQVYNQIEEKGEEIRNYISDIIRAIDKIDKIRHDIEAEYGASVKDIEKRKQALIDLEFIAGEMEKDFVSQHYHIQMPKIKRLPIRESPRLFQNGDAATRFWNKCNRQDREAIKSWSSDYLRLLLKHQYPFALSGQYSATLLPAIQMLAEGLDANMNDIDDTLNITHFKQLNQHVESYRRACLDIPELLAQECAAKGQNSRKNDKAAFTKLERILWLRASLMDEITMTISELDRLPQHVSRSPSIMLHMLLIDIASTDVTKEAQMMRKLIDIDKQSSKKNAKWPSREFAENHISTLREIKKTTESLDRQQAEWKEIRKSRKELAALFAESLAELKEASLVDWLIISERKRDVEMHNRFKQGHSLPGYFGSLLTSEKIIEKLLDLEAIKLEANVNARTGQLSMDSLYDYGAYDRYAELRDNLAAANSEYFRLLSEAPEPFRQIGGIEEIAAGTYHIDDEFLDSRKDFDTENSCGFTKSGGSQKRIGIEYAQANSDAGDSARVEFEIFPGGKVETEFQIGGKMRNVRAAHRRALKETVLGHKVGLDDFVKIANHESGCPYISIARHIENNRFELRLAENGVVNDSAYAKVGLSMQSENLGYIIWHRDPKECAGGEVIVNPPQIVAKLGEQEKTCILGGMSAHRYNEVYNNYRLLVTSAPMRQFMDDLHENKYRILVKVIGEKMLSDFCKMKINPKLNENRFDIAARKSTN